MIKRQLLLATAVLVSSLAVTEARAADRCSTTPPDTLVRALVKQAPGLRSDVLRLALDASACAKKRGAVKRDELLTVIDYSLPSNEPRLWVFDLAKGKLLYRELVAHGKNSGFNIATKFSNVNGSLATSLGLFVTGGTYIGSNGYSMRMLGLEKGVNDKAFERAIVMHGAPYVSNKFVRSLGRIGRSWGCPALRPEIAREVIDTIKGGSPIFAYYPEKSWLSTSAYFSPTTKIADASVAGGR